MRRPLCLAALLYALAVLLFLNFSPPEPEDFSAFHKETVVVRGTVSDKEYRTGSDGSTKLLVTLRDCSMYAVDTGPAGAVQPSDDVLCRVGDGTPESAEVADSLAGIGAVVRIRGTLRTFSTATNDGEFDSQRYYRTLGYTTFSLNNAELVAYSADGDPFGDTLYRFKWFLAGVLDRNLAAEDASILKAMLLGEKGSLSAETREMYRTSGIIHILAISGLHISLLGMGLFRLLRKVRLPVLPAAAAAVLFILLYGKMVGLGASSFRAVFMFLMHMLALVLHRTYDLLTALSLACVLLLLQQPLWLLDSGFQFSFGAVLGIALLMPAFESRVMRTCSVTLATVPVYLLSYGTFPLWSILLNLAVIPLMSVVMGTGLLVLALGSLSPVLGAGPGFVTHLLLLFYRALCGISGVLPGHQLNIGAPYGWELLLYVCLLAAVASAKDYMPEMIKTFAVVSALAILCLRFDGGLDAAVIDVGQGDGILLRYEGTNILIDGGSTSKDSLSRYQLTPLLQHYGIRRLDYCIVTHEDEDHISGVREVIRQSRTHRESAACQNKGRAINQNRGRAWWEYLTDDSENGITIGTLCLPSCTEEAKTENYRELEEAAEEKNIPIVYLKEGDVIAAEKLSAEDRHVPQSLSMAAYAAASEDASPALCMLCLHPEKESAYEEPNERSIVLYLTYGSFSMLLTGDLEGGGEEEMISYVQQRQEAGQFSEDGTGKTGTPVPVTVLKVAHHGSSGATTEAFLAQFHPQYAVISCGVDNRYGHPHEETLERLENAGIQSIFDTRYAGEIRFHTDGRRLRIVGKGGEAGIARSASR